MKGLFPVVTTAYQDSYALINKAISEPDIITHVGPRLARQFGRNGKARY